MEGDDRTVSDCWREPIWETVADVAVGGIQQNALAALQFLKTKPVHSARRNLFLHVLGTLAVDLFPPRSRRQHDVQPALTDRARPARTRMTEGVCLFHLSLQ